MKTFILVCVCLMGESYGAEDPDGVGAFAYNGPSGRYGGTYGLKNGQVVNQQGTFPPNFAPPTFPDLDNFFPDYFNNLENILQEATPPFIRPSPFIRSPPFRRSFLKPFFKRTFDNVENQRLAYAAATKAFDLTTNRAASNQYLAPFRYPYGGNLQGFNAFAGGPGYQGFPGYQGYQGPIYPGLGYQGQGFPGLDMSSFGPNSAYAGAAIGPDFMHQMASINPSNPSNPNVNKFNNLGSQPTGFKSVSSSSFASSHTDGSGRKTESRRAETTVNNNGVVTRYKVEN